MEEGSEAHMETDVSSTTEDISDTQEVTGSNGNVEMVVIVEKVNEEDANFSQQDDSQLPMPSTEEETNKQLSPHLTPKKVFRNLSNSPGKVTESQKTPEKSQQTPEKSQKTPEKSQKTPEKSQKTPEKSQNTPEKSQKPPETSQKTSDRPQKIPEKVHAASPNKLLQKNKAEEVTVSVDQSEAVVDSSSKTDIQETPESVPVVTNSTPTKSKEVDVDLKTSQHTSPKKPDLSTSPVKDQIQHSTTTSPNKDSQTEEKVESTPIQEESLETTTLNGKAEEPEKIQDDLSEKTVSSQMDVDKEATNDTLSETHSESSEKEHNKSISRELKSLIKSAKESKIISECTQLTSKTRKSRVPLDASNSSLNISVEADKIHDKRRYSDNSQKSNCSEKSDKPTAKRSMRSQNPEFVNKVKQFLNSVTSKVQKESDEGTDEEIEPKSKESKITPVTVSPKKRKVAEEVVQEKTSKLRSDPYCWRCHWAVEQAPNEKAHQPMTCTICPRVYHYKCLSGAERNKINSEKSWVCPECMGVLHAESSETRSAAMRKISLAKLSELLKHAMERMSDLNGIEPFLQPVDRTMFPDYDKYVVHPMDLSLMKENIASGHYGSTEAFLADAQWILHNSIIFNTLQSKLTAAARQLVRSCRTEMGEIEACPECYAAAHARKPTWFTDVCTTPHILLWAKLKGFPYWPAKGMSVNNSGLVDVRFFGAHDRAWVPAKDCFLFSEKDPNNFRTKRQDILDSMQEAEQHIRNISRKYGKFVYPPFKTQFDPAKLTEQLKIMIPSFEGEIRPHLKDKPATASPSAVKDKSRSNSKSSKGSHTDSYTSDSEELSVDSAVKSRKMADGAEIAREEEDTTGDKDKADKTMEVDSPIPPPKEVVSRKRRRSEMEEAVITIIDSKEKKKKLETEEAKPEEDKSPSKASKDEATKEQTPTVAEEKDVTQSKDNEPSSSTNEKDKQIPKLTPIKLVISKSSKSLVVTKKPTGVKTGKIIKVKINKTLSTEKNKSKDEKTKNKDEKDKNKEDKDKIKDDKAKSQKRRNSKVNKSLNNSNTANTSKTEKLPEKKYENNSAAAKERAKEAEKTKEAEKAKEAEKVNDAEKAKEAESAKENKEQTKPTSEKSLLKSRDSPKSVKERIQFDDDTSLAVIARESKTNNNLMGMPTISSVRSLSTTAQKTGTTITKTTANSKSVEITIDTSTDSSIFVPTSSDNVRNMKEAVDKLQRLRNSNEQSMVGRVGVRAFARMTSPEPQTKKDNANTNKDVQVEIKAEPIDLDDPDRHMEKMDLMNAFRLQPVNTTSLRDVRINKVVVPTTANAKKSVVKTPEVRPRARKTFPQPKKPDDGRSELNSKNSMVYIPIQPPVTPGPVRGTRMTPVSVSNGPPSVSRVMTATSSCNNIVNTVTTPLIPSKAPMSSASVNATTTTTSLPLIPSVGKMPNAGPIPSIGPMANVGPMSNVGPLSNVGNLPTNVHTVPLITSVNGQWTFSLQPVMSVGGVDVLIQDDAQTPMMNGLPDRSNAPASIVPIVPTPVVAPSNPMLVPSSGPILPTTPSVLPSILPSSGPLPPTTTAVALPNMASSPVVTQNRTTDVAPGEPPRLQQRPALINPLDSQAPVGVIPTPSSAGPLTAKLNQNAVKLADFFRNLLEDSLEKVDEPMAEVTRLKLQLEETRWRHRQEVEEMKHNHELTLAEMRSSFEKEKSRVVSEVRLAVQADLESAVKAAKAKQWCANCNQEAQFYCCWNTSYCDYPCQRAHWSQHFAVCTQQRTQDGENSGDPIGTPPESRLQPQPDNLPKHTSAPSATPTLTVGGKLASRPTQDQTKTSSIIINLEKDGSGNSKLKCVGTYKVPVSQPQLSTPLVLNKQLMNNEDSSKKVVTSGGYLIVGASNTSNVVTPPRRTHTIQYYT